VDSVSFFDFGAISQDAIDSSTIDQLADRYCEEKARKNPTTGTRYRRELQFFFDTLRRFGGDPEEPSRQQVDRYLQYLALDHQSDHPGPCVRECAELPYEPATIGHRRDVLAGFYEYVSAVPGRPNRNPVKKLYVEIPEKEVDILTPEETETLWAGVRAKSYRDAAAVGLAGGMGLRRAEIILARAENLGRNEVGPTLRFWRVKGRYWQTENVPLPTYEMIQRTLAGRTHGPIITTSNTKKLITHPDTGQLEPPHITIRGLNYVFEQIRAYTGIRPNDLKPHLLRHGAITYDCTLKALSTTRLKKYYGHVSDKDHHRYNAFANKTYAHEIHTPMKGRDFWTWAA
jgi:site-specific recombinase XerD